MVENKRGQHIKVFRSYRGRENESHAFRDFCYHHGIQRQNSIAKTPQQNGVVERKNQSIMEMAGCMLTGRHLSD